MTADFASLADESFCYLTTTGRVTGRAHTIEIWFAVSERTLFMLSGSGPRHRADWVRNLTKMSTVTVRIRDHEFSGTGRVVSDPDEGALARRLLFEKYTPTYSGDLTDWRDTALPIAVDLVV